LNQGSHKSGDIFKSGPNHLARTKANFRAGPRNNPSPGSPPRVALRPGGWYRRKVGAAPPGRGASRGPTTFLRESRWPARGGVGGRVAEDSVAVIPTFRNRLPRVICLIAVVKIWVASTTRRKKKTGPTNVHIQSAPSAQSKRGPLEKRPLPDWPHRGSDSGMAEELSGAAPNPNNHRQPGCRPQPGESPAGNSKGEIFKSRDFRDTPRAARRPERQCRTRSTLVKAPTCFTLAAGLGAINFLSTCRRVLSRTGTSPPETRGKTCQIFGLRGLRRGATSSDFLRRNGSLCQLPTDNRLNLTASGVRSCREWV